MITFFVGNFTDFKICTGYFLPRRHRKRDIDKRRKIGASIDILSSTSEFDFVEGSQSMAVQVLIDVDCSMISIISIHEQMYYHDGNKLEISLLMLTDEPKGVIHTCETALHVAHCSLFVPLEIIFHK